MKMFFAALALLAVWGNSACAEDCKSIADAQARLACFDKSAKAPKAAIKKPPTDEFADAVAALVRKLTDPESARFTDLFKVSTPDEGEVTCGMVNSKNRMGGYAGARGLHLP